jgi:tetratricopeptide (TPR) repeat protein
MDLISQITSSDLFVRLAKALLAAEYKDFQTIDDSGGDSGNDGYSESKEILFQIYCPEKPNKTSDTSYKSKIKKDLDKAKKLIDSGKYKIKDWIFLTSSELREPVQTYLRAEATARGMNGIAWASPKLTELFAKYPYLRKQFPDLIQPDIENEINKISERLDAVDDVKKEYHTKLERSYQRRIDQAKEKLDQEKYETAKREYDLILGDLTAETEKIDPHIYFRVYNNLGIAEHNLQNNEKAIELFEKAYNAEPDLPMAICKHALSKLLKGVPEEGLLIIDELLKKCPTDDHIIITKANILHALNEYDNLISFLKDKGKIKLVHWYEGFDKMAKKDFDGAILSFENVVKIEPKNVRALMLIAQNVMIGTRDFVKNNPVPPDKMPQDITEKFKKAIDCLKESIRILSEIENKNDLEMAYINLSGCYVALGLFKECVEAADQAIAINPRSSISFLNKGIAQLKAGHYREAIENFQAYKNFGGGDLDIDRHIAFCALKIGDLITAEKIISELIEGPAGLDLDVSELAIDLYSRKLGDKRLNPLLERLEKEFPDNPQALRIRASYIQKIGMPDADKLLLGALHNSSSESEKILAELDLADLRFDQKDYSAAADIYKKYTNILEGNQATLRFAQCLYNSGQHGTLLDYINTLSEKIKKSSLIEQLEAYTNLYLGNLEKTSKLFEKLFEKNPDNLQYVVYYGMCCFRLGKESDAKIAFDAIKNRIAQASDLIILAGGYEFIGEWDTAIDLTFKALEGDPNNPKAHLAYIFTFLKREQADGKEPTEKYITAFQKSIGEFNKRFPEEKTLQGFEVKDGDVSQILKMVDQIAEVTDNATSLYKDSQAPMAFVPKLTGKKSFDVWAAFTQMPEVGIKVSFGSPDEIKTEVEVIEKNKGKDMVVDIYPLFLLAHLDWLELMSKLFRKVYIHQSVMDELTETIDDRKISARKGVSSLAKINGRHQMTKISADQVKKSLDLLEKIRNFISTNPSVEIRGFAKEKSDEERNIINALDKSTRDSALLAQELRLPLFCDDCLLRAVISRDNSLKSFCSQTLIVAACENKYISLNEKFEAQRKMIDLNYEFISVDANFMFNQLKSVDYDAQKISTVISRLAKKETSMQSLSVVLADLLFMLMLEKTVVSHVKLTAFKHILKDAKQNHNLENIEQEILNNLQRRIRPEKHEELKRIIKVFFKEI